MFISDITVSANTDGKTGTTAINFSNYITGLLVGMSYIPDATNPYTTGNSVGAYKLRVTRDSTGAGQDDVQVKMFAVPATRKHYTVSQPMRGSTGRIASATTGERMPFVPMTNERLRVVVAPATSAGSKSAIIRLLIDGPPTLENST